MRLHDAWIAAVVLALAPGCRRHEKKPPPAPAAPAPAVLRFLPEATAVPLGCFAWSKELATHACVLGHHEPEPDATSVAIAFVGPAARPGIPLRGGRLDDATRGALDAAMVAGSFVAAEEPPWKSTGEAATVGDHAVSLDGEAVRVARGGATIFERRDRHIPHFTPRCQLRSAAQGAGRIVVERRCVVRDEGVDVTEIDAWSCDATHCT